jgi:hypothetical protein
MSKARQRRDSRIGLHHHNLKMQSMTPRPPALSNPFGKDTPRGKKFDAVVKEMTESPVNYSEHLIRKTAWRIARLVKDPKKPPYRCKHTGDVHIEV